MRIIYALSGEGLGHVVRSKVLLEALAKEHDVHVATSRRALHHFEQKFATTRLLCFYLTYRNNGVQRIYSTLSWLLKFPFMLVYNLRLLLLFLRFKPDLVITDFEPFCNYAAWLFRVPSVSIDNQHIITCAKLPRYGGILDWTLAKFVVTLSTFRATHTFITTFFYPAVTGRRAWLFPPILRNQILRAKPKTDDYVLVYQTSKSDTRLIPVLRQLRERFVVYGLDKDSCIGNITLRKFNDTVFFKDLAGCKAVIANGGFGTITEALYLGKPVLSVPVQYQYEQLLNAVSLQKLGYGKYSREITVNGVSRFLAHLETYRRKLRLFPRKGNTAILDRLDAALKDAAQH